MYRRQMYMHNRVFKHFLEILNERHIYNYIYAFKSNAQKAGATCMLSMAYKHIFAPIKADLLTVEVIMFVFAYRCGQE